MSVALIEQCLHGKACNRRAERRVSKKLAFEVLDAKNSFNVTVFISKSSPRPILFSNLENMLSHKLDYKFTDGFLFNDNLH